MNNERLYLQLPKCYSKQGLITTNKKAYVDLMFNNEDESVIEWFEKLETQLIYLIHQKKRFMVSKRNGKRRYRGFFQSYM